MARVSIYVPEEMKSRMDELEDAVNRSSVAQGAFDEEIKKRFWKKGSDMNAVVERLRASKVDYEKHEAERGYEEGVEWAKETATYGQLKKLAETDLGWDLKPHYEYGEMAKWLDERLGLEAPESIFASFRDDGVYPSDEYAESFMNGAVEVWSEVAGQL